MVGGWGGWGSEEEVEEETKGLERSCSKRNWGKERDRRAEGTEALMDNGELCGVLTSMFLWSRAVSGI